MIQRSLIPAVALICATAVAKDCDSKIRSKVFQGEFSHHFDKYDLPSAQRAIYDHEKFLCDFDELLQADRLVARNNYCPDLSISAPDFKWRCLTAFRSSRCIEFAVQLRLITAAYWELAFRSSQWTEDSSKAAENFEVIPKYLEQVIDLYEGADPGNFRFFRVSSSQRSLEAGRVRSLLRDFFETSEKLIKKGIDGYVRLPTNQDHKYKSVNDLFNLKHRLENLKNSQWKPYLQSTSSLVQ